MPHFYKERLGRILNSAVPLNTKPRSCETVISTFLQGSFIRTLVSLSTLIWVISAINTYTININAFDCRSDLIPSHTLRRGYHVGLSQYRVTFYQSKKGLVLICCLVIITTWQAIEIRWEFLIWVGPKLMYPVSPFCQGHCKINTGSSQFDPSPRLQLPVSNLSNLKNYQWNWTVLLTC